MVSLFVLCVAYKLLQRNKLIKCFAFLGINNDENSTASGSSESSTGSVQTEDCFSQEADDNSTVDSESSNTNSLAAELENELEPSAADMLESSPESNDSKTDELDMSFTETDNANTCLDDVTHKTDRVNMTTADGPPDNDPVQTIDTADVDVDDRRQFVSSDRSCSDLWHDTRMSESMLVSHVAMDIN